MDISASLVTLVFTALIALFLFLLFKQRINRIKWQPPSNSVLYDNVRWGRVGKLSILKMGVFVLTEKTLSLMAKDGVEIFSAPVRDAEISFVSTKMGLNISVDGVSYDVRLDYGSLSGYMDASKRYELWAQKIEETGGNHFINDQNSLARPIFNPKTNRIYLKLSFGILLAFFIFGLATMLAG